MKSKILLILVILLFPSTAVSGSIYGKIEIQKNDVDETAQPNTTTYLETDLKIKCDNELYEEKVKIPGVYAIDVEKTGECILTITIIGTKIGTQELNFKVLSTEQAVRYNFILKENNEGHYSLKRN